MVPVLEANDALSDRALVRRALTDGLDAFTELVDRYRVRLYSFIVRRIGDDADAEDLCQESFLRAWTHLRDYDEKWQFSTWLYTIAERLAISHGRKKRPQALNEETPIPLLDDPGHEVEMRDEWDRLWERADEVLKPEARGLLYLRYAEGLTIPELSQITGKTAVAVRVGLHRARAALAREFSSEETAMPMGQEAKDV